MHLTRIAFFFTFFRNLYIMKNLSGNYSEISKESIRFSVSLTFGPLFIRGFFNVITPVTLSVCKLVRGPLLNVSETIHLFARIQGTIEVQRWQSLIFEKILGGDKWGKIPIRGIFDVFCPYLCIKSLRVSEISYTL